MQRRAAVAAHKQGPKPALHAAPVAGKPRPMPMNACPARVDQASDCCQFRFASAVKHVQSIEPQQVALPSIIGMCFAALVEEGIPRACERQQINTGGAIIAPRHGRRVRRALGLRGSHIRCAASLAGTTNTVCAT